MTTRLKTLEDIKGMKPGDRCEVDDTSGLEALINSSILVKKSRPNMFWGVGGGALYTVRDMKEGPVAESFLAVEATHPHSRVVYDDNDGAWYALITVEDNLSCVKAMNMCVEE